MTIRAVTHIHTRYSWDSRINHPQLASELTRLGIDLAMVTDHNTFDGAIEFAEYCATHSLPIVVPVAAEIRTNRGDVIAVFDPGTTPPAVDGLLEWERMQRIVSEMGGLLWLPHPYRSHTDVEELAASADAIEVFNARCTSEENRKAEALATAVGARHAFGVDAHRVRELDRVIAEYPETSNTAVHDVFASSAVCRNPRTSPRSDRMAAEITNGIKKRRPTLVGYFALRYLEQRAREAFRR